MIKLEKYKPNKQTQKIIYVMTCILLVAFGAIFLYKSYALYEEKKDFNVINGQVEKSGDLYYAYYVNGTISKDVPTKDSGLTLDTTKSSCNSGVTVSWDDDNWHAILDYSNYESNSTTRTKCTLYFKEKPPLATTLLNNLVSGANTSSTDVYTVPNKTSDSCTYTLAYDGTSDNNLRYVGANPCNYVKIDDELWRIIGVMNNIDDGTGKKETRIKLIRNKSIGTYSWDTSESSVNNGRGVNEWSQADLMKLLNPGYESESVGGSLYYNDSSGNCYSNNATIACDFTTTGLKTNLKNLVGNTLWNTGTNGTNSFTSASNGLASHFYSYERSSNTGKICSSGTDCNDTVERTTTWNGKVGLMYPSDYGYATSGGSTSDRTSCLNKELYNWNSSSYKDCTNNNWLYHSGTAQWTISPYAYSSFAYSVFSVYNTGSSSGGGGGGSIVGSIVGSSGGSSGGGVVGSIVRVNTQSASFSGWVRPSVYLISKTSILDGEGTFENPYQIG